MSTWDLLKEPRNETERVLLLPRHLPWPEAAARAFCDATFYADPACSMRLRPIQEQALYTLHKVGGLAAPIGVGHGKSLIMYLAPLALGAKRPIFMMPPALAPSFEREVAKYREAGFAHVDYTLVPYSTLSQPNATELLDQLQPDLIVADEAHNLRNRTAARTLRFLRYMQSRQDTVFVPLSGTFFDQSMMDAAHLFGLGLREGSPMPAFGLHLNLWSSVLDPHAEGASETDVRYFESVARYLGCPDDFRRAVHKRVRDTAGVVSTDTASLPGVELRIRERKPQITGACWELHTQIAMAKASPDGSVVYDTPGHLAQALTGALNGYWLAWDWGAVGGRDDEWLEAKREWSRLCFRELEMNSRSGYDSPALILESVLAEKRVNTRLYAAAHAWVQVMDRKEPPRVPMWVDRYLVDWVRDELAVAPSPVIVWYRSDAMEVALREAGMEVFGRGSDLTGPARHVAASALVHGEGRNLQEWSRCIVLEPSQSASRWEQLLGRMHRPGQTATFVHCDVCLHARTMDKALERSRFMQEVQGQPQKLLEAVWER